MTRTVRARLGALRASARVVLFSLVVLLGSSGGVLAAVCGDGILDANEECDPNCGTEQAPQGCPLFENGDPNSNSCTNGDTCFRQFTCCKFNCQFVGTPGIPCEDGNDCTVFGQCDQIGNCNGVPVAAGTSCGDQNVTECDLANTCDANGNCLDNFVAAGTPADTLCTDGNDCTFNECDGAGLCQNPARPSADPCGDQSTTECDLPDTCDGAGTCQQNFVAAGTPTATLCADGNDCSFDECDGSGGCQNPPTPEGGECRPAADVCDVPEVCTGGVCPTDTKVAAGTECRSAIDVCDVAEMCDGANNACPPDGFEPAGLPCRAAAGVCDITETCTGSSAACPADAKSNVVCRDAIGQCDLAESCDGVSDTCPPDALKAAGAPCTEDNFCTNEACDGAGSCVLDLDEPVRSECQPTYKCYRGKQVLAPGEDRFPPREVNLQDEFVDVNTIVRRPERLCNPALIDGEDPLLDPIAHLMCYKIKERPLAGQSRFDRVDRTLEDRFGKRTFTIARPESVCVPAVLKECVGGAERTVCTDDTDCPPPATCDTVGAFEDLGINHFKCYKVRAAVGEPTFDRREFTVELDDPLLELKDTHIVKPKLICSPVSQDGSEIVDPDLHITCYKIKDVKGQPKFSKTAFDIMDQFGEEDRKALRGSGKRASFVCVNSFLASP